MALYITTPFNSVRSMWERLLELDNNSTPDSITFPVDVQAEKEAYVLSAYLPGMKSEDLNINVVNDTVTIAGEVKDEKTTEETNFLLKEWRNGQFSRNLTLPDELDAAKAEASLKDGVLTLRLPKAEAALPKAIKVTSK
ncbi:MAG: Hsp20/alpha crystallin family protein [Anaerolineaceae bacterium]|jgi:HSP20 family protein